MASFIPTGGMPYIGVGGKRRGDHFYPELEPGRMPGNRPTFERRSDVVAVERPITLAEIQNSIGGAPSLGNAENNHELFSNFRVMHAVRDIGSSASAKTWMQGHWCFVQSKLYSAAAQGAVSPFEVPQLDSGYDGSDPFSFVLDNEGEDTYSAVRVLVPAHLNLLLQGERKRNNLDDYPSFDSVAQELGLSVGGIVNNQTGFTGPGYSGTGTDGLRQRDLVNFCVEGNVNMIPYFNLNGSEKTAGSLKGMKFYAIIKRIPRDQFAHYGLTQHYVPDNGDKICYKMKPGGSDFVNRPFQLYFVMRKQCPSMSELEYQDDNGYMDRAKVYYLGCVDYVHMFPVGDARAVVNDLSQQAQAGLISVIYDLKEIEFLG